VADSTPAPDCDGSRDACDAIRRPDPSTIRMSVSRRAGRDDAAPVARPDEAQSIVTPARRITGVQRASSACMKAANACGESPTGSM
jgi:hypothetical protein